MVPLRAILGGLAECKTEAQVAEWWRDRAEDLAALGGDEKIVAEQAREAQLKAISRSKR